MFVFCLSSVALKFWMINCSKPAFLLLILTPLCRKYWITSVCVAISSKTWSVVEDMWAFFLLWGSGFRFFVLQARAWAEAWTYSFTCNMLNNILCRRYSTMILYVAIWSFKTWCSLRTCSFPFAGQWVQDLCCFRSLEEAWTCFLISSMLLGSSSIIPVIPIKSLTDHPEYVKALKMFFLMQVSWAYLGRELGWYNLSLYFLVVVAGLKQILNLFSTSIILLVSSSIIPTLPSNSLQTSLSMLWHSKCFSWCKCYESWSSMG